MDPHQGSSRPRALSGAAAELNRRRAFLQNFTPAFRIGQQPQNVLSVAEVDSASSSPSTSISSLSRSSSISPMKSMSNTTTLSNMRFMEAHGLEMLPNGQMVNSMDEYEEELEAEEGDESELGFDEGEMVSDEMGQMELEGVDIDEIDIQGEEEIEEIEAMDDDEEEEEEEVDLEDAAMHRYDQRYACQDDFDPVYDDEELEDESLEEETEEAGPSRSFDTMRFGTSRMPGVQFVKKQNYAPMLSQGIRNQSTRGAVPPEWEENSEEEEDEIEEVVEDRRNQQKPIDWMKPGGLRIEPLPSARVKPLISPDICDGLRKSANQDIRISDNDDLDEEDYLDVAEVERLPARSNLIRQKQNRKPQKSGPEPNTKEFVASKRIKISFTHESSTSPEKKPKYSVQPSQEDSNDVDPNDVEEESTSDASKFTKEKEETVTRRVGRPRKNARQIPEKESNEDENSRTLEGTEDSAEMDTSRSSSTVEGTRRTGRTRKPTKQFVINFGGRTASSRKALDKDGEQSNEKEKSLTMTLFKTIGEAVTRGGRGRGRPKGSTTKIRTPATVSMENIVNEVLNKAPDASTDPDNVESKQEDVESEPLSSKQQKENKSRGSTPSRGRTARTPKSSKDKNKRVPRAKLADIMDDNAMTGYTKPKGEVDTVGSESVEGEEESRFSNGLSVNSPANSNLESAATPKPKKTKATDTAIGDRKPVTAETLFDYWWTREEKSERFMLQEQVSEFLGVTSFKRKYPDLRRRVVDVEERDFLRREKIVTEVQCDLGLTALYFDDVVEILRNDFNSKYLELENVWMQRMEAEIELKKSEVKAAVVERSPLKMKPEDLVKSLIRSTAEWNAALNKDRRTYRSRAMDLQTFTIHEQTGRTKKFILPPEKTKMGYFPVPALVGQYVDDGRVPKLTSDDMKYLPLNTVLYGPMANMDAVADSEDSESDSDDSTSTDDTSSSSDVTCTKEPSSDTDETTGVESCTPLVVGGEGNLGGADALNIICKSCNGGIANNKDSVPEMIIHCTKCKVPNHPSCLELSPDMLPFILKYNWQCTDCKNCIECNDPADEDKMLFCDLCDRGYHIYCVGLRKVPTGRWHCKVCAVCYSCGTKMPSDDDRLAEWHHEFKKGEKNSKFYLHSQCVNCHKLYKKGQYCPCCLKVHTRLDDKSLTECRTCEKWVHAECAKARVTAGGMFGFRCEACETAFKTRTKIRTPFGVCP